MEKKQKQFYVTVDYAKLIAAGIVVFGHCYLADTAGMAWFAGLVKAAVQMFFVFNGYFLYQNGTLQDREKMKRYCRHFLVLLCGWILIYYLWNMLFTEHGQAWFYTYTMQTVQWVCGLNDGHLWYVQNLLAVAVLLHLLDKTSARSWEVFAAALLAGMTGGLLFRALFGVLCGLRLADIKARGENGNAGSGIKAEEAAYAVLGAAGLVVMIIIYQCPIVMAGNAWRDGVAGVGSMFAGMMLALAAIETDLHLQRRGVRLWDSARLRKSSSIIYFIHLMIVPLSTAAVKYLLVNPGTVEHGGIMWSLSVGLLTFAVGALAGIVVPALAKCRWFAWLGKLY